MSKSKFKFIDLFAGIGGFHIAMHELGGECVFASEIDKSARITYENNFKQHIPELFKNGNFNQDITDPKLNYNKIPDFDILCGGFPCQAFSIAGYRKGFNDDKGRGNLFFNILEILDKKKPKGFILENVKNLKTHDKGKTFQIICSHLTSLGYGIKAQVLNSKDFGLHQNRERIFIIGIKDCWKGKKIPLPNENDVISSKGIIELLDKQNTSKILEFKFSKIEKVEIKPFFKIKYENKVWKNIKYKDQSVKYLNPPKSLLNYFQKYEDRNDWDDFLYNFKDGHFKKASDYINSKIKGEENNENWDEWNNDQWNDEGYQNVYQWRRKYVRKNTSGLVPTLTANMGTGGHNVPLIVCGETSNGNKLIRKLTPEECYAIQGFDKKTINKMSKVNIANGQKYKQAGNSVPIDVIKLISKNLIPLIHD